MSAAGWVRICFVGFNFFRSQTGTTSPSPSATSIAHSSAASPSARDIRDVRNKAEKQRRDKLNSHINHLAEIVPFVKNSSKTFYLVISFFGINFIDVLHSPDKRQDKTSVLRPGRLVHSHESLAEELSTQGPEVQVAGVDVDERPGGHGRSDGGLRSDHQPEWQSVVCEQLS